jgi:hypothetical protein
VVLHAGWTSITTLLKHLLVYHCFEVNHNGKNLALFMGILSRTIGMNSETFTQEPTLSRDPSELAMWGRERLMMRISNTPMFQELMR